MTKWWGDPQGKAGCPSFPSVATSATPEPGCWEKQSSHTPGCQGLLQWETGEETPPGVLRCSGHRSLGTQYSCRAVSARMGAGCVKQKLQDSQRWHREAGRREEADAASGEPGSCEGSEAHIPALPTVLWGSRPITNVALSLLKGPIQQRP